MICYISTFGTRIKAHVGIPGSKRHLNDQYRPGGMIFEIGTFGTRIKARVGVSCSNRHLCTDGQ